MSDPEKNASPWDSKSKASLQGLIPDQHSRTLEALSVGGWIAVVAGLLAAVIGFAQGLEAGNPMMGGGASFAVALVAALPGLIIALLGAILVAVSYAGWSNRKTQLALQETLWVLKDSSAR